MSVASNASAMEEEADHVQCDIDGTKVSGWLWRSPFKDGDMVDAAVNGKPTITNCWEWPGRPIEFLPSAS